MFDSTSILSLFMLIISFCRVGDVMGVIYRILFFVSWFGSVSGSLNVLEPRLFSDVLKLSLRNLILRTLCYLR